LLEPWSTGVSEPAETVPRSRRREANSSNASCRCGTWQPRCGLRGFSNPLARAGQSRSGYRMAQEAKAGRRKARGSHNPPDSAHGVPRKGADVRLTIDPKAVVRELKPGGKVGCSVLQTSLLVPWWTGIRLTGSTSTGR